MMQETICCARPRYGVRRFNVVALAVTAALALLPSCTTSSTILTAPSMDTATPPAAPRSVTPRFEPAACEFPSVGRPVECGYLAVPEDRSRPSQAIRLHVAIVKSTSLNPAPDPVIYLTGGPGAAAFQSLAFTVGTFSSILNSRDLIVFDQRGVGYSQPSLDCPEVDKYSDESLATNASRTDQRTLFIQAYIACRDRLLNQGVNLDAYNSAASAADVNDLRSVLGYDKVNLYGISYGTRLALTIMRDFPGSVRSVILDSTLPLQANLLSEWGANAERSFDLVFDQCAEIPRCKAAYPDLKDTFFALVARLDVQPLQIAVYHPTGSGMYWRRVDGDRLIGDMRMMLYSTSAIPYLPKMIYDMSRGDNALFSRLLGNTPFQGVYRSEGMATSVMCSEEAPFRSAQKNESTKVPGHPRLREAFTDETQGWLALCAAWGVKQANPVENEPVVSDIPTLVLAGRFDPVTPPAMGKQAAATLSQSYFYESPNTGHGVFFGEGFCTRDMVTHFLDDPTKSPINDCRERTFFFVLP